MSQVSEPSTSPRPTFAKSMSNQPNPSNTPNEQPALDAKEVHRIIGQRLRGFRSKAWEDDISRNTLDTEPFKNLAPICERDEAEFKNRPRLITDEMMAGNTILELAAKDIYPIPCARDREGYSDGFDGIYWMSGLADHLKIMQVANRLGVDVQSYLDFGCASGRVLRHFAIQSETPECWGSDINARHVRWLYEHMPMNVKPIANHCIPSIPIPDASVDVISAFSVFTHIDTFETCWLAEINRILRPGGFAYLTVHNEDTWEVLRAEMDNPENRLIQSVLKVDPEFANKVHEAMPDTRTIYRFTDFGPYRAQVFHSNNYLHQVWGRFFNVQEILPCHHIRQTVVVLTKK